MSGSPSHRRPYLNWAVHPGCSTIIASPTITKVMNLDALQLDKGLKDFMGTPREGVSWLDRERMTTDAPDRLSFTSQFFFFPYFNLKFCSYLTAFY